MRNWDLRRRAADSVRVLSLEALEKAAATALLSWGESGEDKRDCPLEDDEVTDTAVLRVGLLR